MGQNNSSGAYTHNSAAQRKSSSSSGGTRSPPPPRPPSPPQIPKIPNYAVPENRVLPIAAGELPNKRQLLRPVSQELSKFHPEYADIFQQRDLGGLDEPLGGGPGNGYLGRGGGGVGEDGKENYRLTMDSPLNVSVNSTPTTAALPFENGGLKSPSSSAVPRLSHVTPNGDISRKPNNIELSRSHSMQETRSNGHVHMNGYVNSNPSGNDVTDRGRGIHRTNSLDRSSSPSKMVRAHKRFPSASTSLANEASVIPEDPREHLYTHWRQDPFTNPTPAVTSLPMKNSFDLDYKMNLTYAQLAEHRRQKRVADMESKTGQKLADLNADLQEQSSVPVSPFDRHNFTPAKATNGSVTGSSDSGVSKSKKRRAPAPPGQAGPRDSSPGRLSLDVEPPADYDLDDPSPPMDEVLPWRPNLSRQNSTASSVSVSSRNSKGPAPRPPPPPPLPTSPAAQQTSRAPKADDRSNGTTPASGTLPSKSSAPVSAASARLIAQAKAEMEALKKLEMILKEKDSDPPKAQEGKDGSNAGATNDASSAEKTEREDDPGRAEDKAESKEKRGEGDDEVSRALSDGKASPMSFSSGETESSLSNSGNSSSNGKTDLDGARGPRRLNSLLQHDILLAAQARGAKGQVKAKTPTQHVKPKDPAQLFREELAKAATAREERAKSGESEAGEKGSGFDVDDKDVSLVFKSDLVKVKRRTVPSEPPSSGAPGQDPPKPEGRSVPPPVSPKPTTPLPSPDRKSPVSRSEPNLLAAQAKSKPASGHAQGRQRPPEGYTEDSDTLRKAASCNGILDLSDDDDNDGVAMEEGRKSSSSARHQFSQDWKPEDDLDSDDDMRDDFTYSRNGAALEASDGFKSSIIPSKVDDLKTAKRKNSKSGKRRESGSSTDEKNKFGSIRKFQKSVHKSVRNAFGSISKASGKLLRRNKSHDLGLDDVEGIKYRVTATEEEEQAENLSRPLSMNGIDNARLALNMNGHLSERDSDDDDDDEEEDDGDEEDVDNNNDPASSSSAAAANQMRLMKRAGVAYVGRKGQIVVLPEFETVKVDHKGNVIEDREDEGRAPRIFKKKKKKFTYESTVRRQEKDRVAEQIAEEIRQKERQIEFERRKQQDMEREFIRLRDLETQERWQRLQTSQQQMSLLQQQQQQQLSSMQMMQGSSLAGHQRYSMPEFSAAAAAAARGGIFTPSSSMGLAAGVGPVQSLPPINMSSYSVQTTAPFLAGPGSLPTNAAAPTTTTTTVGGYDVNYLSNYMRMMGIQPPTTQQQWAYLLSSVSGVTPPSLFDPTSSSSSSSKAHSLLVNSAGPDLSHIFPSKAAPGFADTSALVAQKASLMNIIASGQLPQQQQQNLPAAGDGLALNSSAGGMGLVSVTDLVPANTVSPQQHQQHLQQQQIAVASSSAQPATSAAGQTAVAEKLSNPVYCSSDEDEAGRKEGAGDAATGLPSSKTRSSRSGGKDPKRRPQSSVLPLGQPSSALPLGLQSNVYRDVTSVEEAGVTRVKVPDYRPHSVYVVPDTNGDVGDSDRDSSLSTSSEEEVRDMNERVMKNVRGSKASGVEGSSLAGKGPSFSSFSQAENLATATTTTTTDSNATSSFPATAVSRSGSSLPPNVYGPLGFKPVSFNRGQPRSSLQTESAVDR